MRTAPWSGPTGSPKHRPPFSSPNAGSSAAAGTASRSRRNSTSRSGRWSGAPSSGSPAAWPRAARPLRRPAPETTGTSQRTRSAAASASAAPLVLTGRARTINVLIGRLNGPDGQECAMALRKPRITILCTVLTVSTGCLSLTVTLAGQAAAAGTTYYVNCAAAADGNGSLATPWNNLTTVDTKTFAPSDSLLFNRGTTCSGSFVFSSSGTSASPITIGAYGTGALPAIDGTGQNRAVKLLDTSYVTLQDLEVRNSRVWGVLVTTDHDAPAVGTTLWAGIFVWGVQVEQDFQWRKDSQNQAVQSRNITIQNSTVHNTFGDGIAIYMAHEGTIQNNVVY